MRPWPLVLGVGVLVVACGPKKVDDVAARETTPEQLCERYLSLEGKSMKLEGEILTFKRQKCLAKASGWKNDPPYWACMVQCTYAADSWTAARACRGSCASKASGVAPADSVSPEPEAPPPPPAPAGSSM